MEGDGGWSRLQPPPSLHANAPEGMAQGVTEFWQRWNIPVHTFAVRAAINPPHPHAAINRPSQACLLCGSPPCTAAQKLHVYAPMRRRGYSRMAAMSVVFLLSAFGHELFAALPLGSRRVTAFAGMLSQAPLSYAVEAVVPKRARTTFGRVLTMLALSVTPMAPIAVYAYDYIGDRW